MLVQHLLVNLEEESREEGGKAKGCGWHSDQLGAGVLGWWLEKCVKWTNADRKVREERTNSQLAQSFIHFSPTETCGHLLWSAIIKKPSVVVIWLWIKLFWKAHSTTDTCIHLCHTSHIQIKEIKRFSGNTRIFPQNTLSHIHLALSLSPYFCIFCKPIIPLLLYLLFSLWFSVSITDQFRPHPALAKFPFSFHLHFPSVSHLN